MAQSGLRFPFFHERTTNPLPLSVGDDELLAAKAKKEYEGKCTDPEDLKQFQISHVDPVFTTITERALFDQPTGKDTIYRYILDVLEAEDTATTPRIETMEIDADGFPIPSESKKKVTVEETKVGGSSYWADQLLPLLRPLAVQILKKRPSNVSTYMADLIKSKLKNRKEAKERRVSRRRTRFATDTTALAVENTNLSESSDEEKGPVELETICFKFKLQHADDVEEVHICPHPKLPKMLVKVIHKSDEAVWEQQWVFDNHATEEGQRRIMLLIARTLGFHFFVFPTFKLKLHITKKIQRWDGYDFVKKFLDAPKFIQELVGDNPIECLLDDMEGKNSASARDFLTPNERDLNFVDGIEANHADDDEEDDEDADAK